MQTVFPAKLAKQTTTFTGIFEDPMKIL